MLVRVAEVQSLADEMIREPGERHPITSAMGEPAGQVDALGNQQGEVVEPGVPTGRTCSPLLDQHQERTSTGAERHPRAVAIEHLHADGSAVELERALDLGHGEMNGADRGRGRKLGSGRRGCRFELLGIGRENQISPDDTLIKPQVSLSCIVVAAWWQPLSKVR